MTTVSPGLCLGEPLDSPDRFWDVALGTGYRVVFGTAARPGERA